MKREDSESSDIMRISIAERVKYFQDMCSPVANESKWSQLPPSDRSDDSSEPSEQKKVTGKTITFVKKMSSENILVKNRHLFGQPSLSGEVEGVVIPLPVVRDGGKKERRKESIPVEDKKYITEKTYDDVSKKITLDFENGLPEVKKIEEAVKIDDSEKIETSSDIVSNESNTKVIEFDISQFDRRMHDLEGLSDVSDDGYRDEEGEEIVESSPRKNRGSLERASVVSSRRRSTFHNNFKVMPVKGILNREHGSKPCTIFVGTWNCGYQEFPVEVVVNLKASDKVEACEEMDIIVDEINATEMNFEGLKLDEDGLCLPVDDVGDDEVELGEEGRRGFVRQTTRLLTQPQDKEQPLADWIPPNYDIYVISLQETISDNIFSVISQYLSIVCDEPYKRLKFKESRISGYGDGALLYMKSTSIACWVRQSKLSSNGCVKTGSSKATSLSFLNGSKGAVSFVLSVYDQYICFVGCHLPATGKEDRLKARESIISRISESYCGLRNVPYMDVFHHVIWTGDFNFRLQNISLSSAIEKLKKNEIDKLLESDEFYMYSEDLRKLNFVEEKIEFIPTYKKRDGRPILNMNDEDWIEKEYQIRFTTKWYKARHQVERIPSWTDRVIKWSLPEMESCLTYIEDTYHSVTPSKQSVLLASDHNPVGCGYNCYSINERLSMPPVMLKERSECGLC